MKASHRLCVALLCAFGLTGMPASAQDFPTRPIRLIVGNPPGGVNDILGRVLSLGMSKSLGQNVIVENKPGAGGLLAGEYVARQVPADGYTLLITSPGVAIFQIFEKNLRFDPIKDLNHISALVEGQLVVWTSVLTKHNTFNELVAFAKANPGKLNITVPGLQSHPRVIWEGMKEKLGIDFVIIPTKGTAESRVLVTTNQADIAMNDIGTATQEAQAGRGRPLAVTGPRRLAQFPNVPTFDELGHGELFVPFRLGIAAPAATPGPIVARVSGAITSAMQTQEAKDTFAKVGLDVLALSPQETNKRLAAEAAFFMSVARKARIQPE